MTNAFALNMPIFSLQEMRVFRDVCMPGMCTDDERMLNFLISTFGCSPRNVFGAAKSVVDCHNKLKELEKSLSKVDVGSVAARLTCSDSDSLPHKLFHVIVMPDGTFRTTQTEYASNYTWRLVAAHLRHKSSAMFDDAINSGTFNTSMALEFEGGCIRILSAAKERWYQFRSVWTVKDLNTYCVDVEDAKPALKLVEELLKVGVISGSKPTLATTARTLLQQARMKVEDASEADLSDILPDLQNVTQSEISIDQQEAQDSPQQRLLKRIDTALQFVGEAAAIVDAVKKAVDAKTDAQSKVAAIQDVINGLKSTRGEKWCGDLLVMFKDIIASSSPETGSVEFAKREILHVHQREMVDNTTEFATRHSMKFIVPPVGFASFDALSLEGLHQITLNSMKKGPGRDPWPDDPPAVPKNYAAMSQIDAWYHVTKLWCEMQSAHHAHNGYPWASGGEVVLPVYYVVPYSTDGTNESRQYADFKALGPLPKPQTFNDIGERNVDVRVTFVPRVLGVPRMQDWVGHESPVAITAQQLQTYEEILAGRGQENLKLTHEKVDLVHRERTYREW